MNIEQIYNEQKPFIEREIADFYNKFARDIENDERYTLSDDELTELFNELLLMFVLRTTPEGEIERIIDKHYEQRQSN